MSNSDSGTTVIDEGQMEGQPSIALSPSPHEGSPSEPTEWARSIHPRVDNIGGSKCFQTWLMRLGLTCTVVNRHTNQILGLNNRVIELEEENMCALALLREALNEIHSLKKETSRMKMTIEKLQAEVNSAEGGRDGAVDSVDPGINAKIDEERYARKGRMRLKVSVGWSFWKR
jgi:hypothetical protein